MMHFKKHKWRRRQIFFALGNGMLVIAKKKVGIDYLSVLEAIVLGIHFPSFFFGGEFVNFLVGSTIRKNYE